jgi:hypothetical protein
MFAADHIAIDGIPVAVALASRGFAKCRFCSTGE